MPLPSLTSRRAYNRVSEEEEEATDTQQQEEEQQQLQEETEFQSRDDTSNSGATEDGDASASETEALKPDKLHEEIQQEDDGADEGETITVIIMDNAQKKFEIPHVNPETCTVARLKKKGSAVHKIPSSQQRLIYMGRMLTCDETLLQDAKINKDGTIIHLFPKPRVILAQNVNAVSNASSNDPDTDANSSTSTSGGAHVPQIVLNAAEAEMRSSILVLGSPEILDAQNNVKLLSFLLLIITSMELLALLAIMAGSPPPDDVPLDDTFQSQDDVIIPHGSTQDEMRSWRNSDYFDLVLNLFGFYSAMLGIRATTENTRRLAYRYMICTVICGVFWNAFYYYLNVEAEKEMDRERHNHSSSKPDNELPLPPDADYYEQAFYAILIPLMIWLMCCVRAWQFHHLLAEAEMEAETRIQNELTTNDDDENDDDDDNDNQEEGDALV